MLVRLFFILIIVCMSCINGREKERHIIPVSEVIGSGEILDLSEYAASINYIPLETNDSILISRIKNVDMVDRKYVIHDAPYGDTERCMLFDNRGLFVSNIGKHGDDPNEFSSFWAFDINPQTKKILLEAMPKCLEYDLDGSLIKVIDKPKVTGNRLMQILSVDSGHFISATSSPNERKYKAILYERDSDSSKIQKIYPNYYQIEKEGVFKNGTGSTDGKLYRYKDKIRYWRSWDDTIFTFNAKKEIEVAYIFDMGKYKATMEWMSTYRLDYDVTNYVFPGTINESDNYLFIQFCFGRHAPEKFEFTRMVVGEIRHFVNVDVYGVFDKRIGHLKLLNQPVKNKYLGFRNNVDGGPCFWPKCILSDNTMVTWWNADEFLSIYEQLENPSPALKKLAQKLTPEDNPVLMVVTLK